MKTRRAALSLLLLLPVGLLLAATVAPPPADDVLPTATPIASYTDLINHSPFSPPTAPTPAPTPGPGTPPGDWAKSLVVTTALQLKGVYSATVLNRDTNERLLVTNDAKDNPQGIILTSVQWSDTPSQTTLTLQHGQEFATKKLEGSASGAPGLAPVMPMTPQPGMGARALPAPQPAMRPAGAPGAPGAGGFPGPPTNSPNIRRPIIRANPAPGAPIQGIQPLPGATLGRPPVNPAAARGGVTPQTPASDDDDDDDDSN